MRVSEAHIGRRGTCIRCGQTLELTPAPGAAVFPETVADDGVAVDWREGDVILGLYEVQSLLGEGGMGKVYKVHHRVWGMDLAVKAPRSAVVLRRDGVARFERECATWINLGLHPHIVTCFYVRRLGGIPRVFAEYVEGGSLWSLIRERKIYEGGHEATLARMLDIAIQFTWGLHHAHQLGYVHQDVKPGNLLVSPSGIAKVCDFGLARAMQLAAGEEEVSRGMTRVYRSPEQARGQESTPRTDMWGFGLAILEMFCGRHKWTLGEEAPVALQAYCQRQKSLASIIPVMPPKLAQLLACCFRENPAERPESMLDIAKYLQGMYRELTGADYPRRPPRPADALADSLNNRAISLLDLGRRDEATRIWSEALRTDPHHPDSTYNAGLIQWRSGELTDETLLNRLNEIDRLHPGDPLSPYRTAQVHIERGDYAAALPLLEEMDRSGTVLTEVATALQTVRARTGRSRGPVDTLKGHNDAITAVHISADGRFGLSGSDDNTIRLWSLDEQRCLRTLEGHTNTVRALRFHRNGQHALSCSADKTVRLWHTQTGNCVHIFEGHSAAVRAIDVSGDGQRIASGAEDKTVRVWDFEARECVAVLQGHTHWAGAVAINETGSRVLSGGHDHTLRLWKVDSGECAKVLTGHEAIIECVAWSANERIALSGDESGMLRIWQLETGECLRGTQAHEGAVSTLALTADGRHALTGGRDGRVRLWIVETGQCLCTFDGHKGAVQSAALTPEGRLALSGGRDREVHVWRTDCQAPPLLASPMVCRGVGGEAASSAGAAFAEALDKARAAMRSGDAIGAAGHLRAVRAQPGRRRAPETMAEWRKLYSRLPRTQLDSAWEHASLAVGEAPLKTLRATADGRFLLTLSGQNTVNLWEVGSGNCVSTFGAESGPLKAADISENGRLSATAAWDVRIWDTKFGKLMRNFERPSDGIHSLALSPGGEFVATGGSEWVRVWHVVTGRCLWAAQGHAGETTTLHWSRDGEYLLSGGDDTALTLWHVARCQTLRVLRGKGGPIRAAVMSHDGRYALATSGSRFGAPGQIALWDLMTERQVQTFSGHQGDAGAVCLSVNARYALSGGDDKTVRLWEVSTGRCLLALEGHGAAIAGVALAPDMGMAYSADTDGVLKLWQFDWELEDRQPADWDNDLLPFFRVFLTRHTPFAAALPTNRSASESEIKAALTRRGHPAWSDAETELFLRYLGASGYGWLKPASIRARLKKAAAAWTAPPTVYRSSSVAVRGLARRLKDFLGR
jgi:WD40 repeat protein